MARDVVVTERKVEHTDETLIVLSANSQKALAFFEDKCGFGTLEALFIKGSPGAAKAVLDCLKAGLEVADDRPIIDCSL